MSDPTDLPGVSEWPEPVTLERVRVLVETSGVTATPTEKDALRVRFAHGVIEISVATTRTTVLRVLGLASSSIPREQETDLATFVNNWHRERVWPTLLWTSTDAGALALRSVFAMDVTAGATNQQLATAVQLGLSASSKGLEAAREALQKGTTEPDLG